MFQSRTLILFSIAVLMAVIKAIEKGFAKSTKIKIQGFSWNSIITGANCWIGSNVIILKGASIGNNTIIGAGNTIDYEIKDNEIIKR